MLLGNHCIIYESAWLVAHILLAIIAARVDNQLCNH